MTATLAADPMNLSEMGTTWRIRQDSDDHLQSVFGLYRWGEAMFTRKVTYLSCAMISALTVTAVTSGCAA